MTLDCTQLKPGDKVRLRDGEICTVETNDHGAVPIGLAGDNWYYPNGSYYDNGIEDPHDIVEILPPEQAPPTVLTTGSRVITLTHDTKGFERPDVIDCNGKRYVPADSPSLFTGRPFSLITRPDEGLVAIRYDDKLFTPADAWPEPIRARQPTEEDANKNGLIQVREDGVWFTRSWIGGSYCLPAGAEWRHCPDWKPKPTPVYTREEAIEELRECANVGEAPDADLLKSIIAHLEAQP